MAHGSLDDFMRTHTAVTPAAAGANGEDDDDDPTGWGRLPWAPTDRDRKSNADWDSLYGAWREEHWENYAYTDDWGNEQQGQRPRDETERAFYDERKAIIDEYDAAVEWRNKMLPMSEYYKRKRQIETFGLGRVKLIPQLNDDHIFSLRVVFPPSF